MSEGVIATDTQQRVLLVNAAAGALLDFPTSENANRGALCEMVRSEPILRAAREVLTTRQSTTFQLGPSQGHYLEVTVCTFPANASPQGVVIVARDTTQSMRYQELRKEFVANVSHELRTPLTAIKGFAETLRDGALHDPVHGPKFLATIENHVDQLTNLVNDLLELSRLDSLPGPAAQHAGGSGGGGAAGGGFAVAGGREKDALGYAQARSGAAGGCGQRRLS